MDALLRWVAFLTSLACATASAKPPAGILAHACDTPAGTAVYLLAFDPQHGRDGWGHLGGKADSGESADQTALREFHEESNCAYSLEILQRRRLVKFHQSSNGFISFSLEVPFISARDIEARNRAICPHVERERWVWVRHADIVRGVAPNSGTRTRLPTYDGSVDTIHLWHESASAMAGLLWTSGKPVPDPCLSSQNQTHPKPLRQEK
ncbi:MAG: NUDIX hydrolase [Pelomonas sp.]|nr:NUDIX hydrolase [Roseateles sp.]